MEKEGIAMRKVQLISTPEGNTQINLGIYSAAKFFQKTDDTELEALSPAIKEKITNDLDSAIAGEGKWLAKAKVALGADGRLWTCPLPLYDLTNGCTSETHLVGISIAPFYAGKVAVKRKPDSDLDCGGSLAPMCAYMMVPVRDWEAGNFKPALETFDEVVGGNIANLARREGGIESEFGIAVSVMVEVDHPRAQPELLLVADLTAEQSNQLALEGWDWLDKAEVIKLIKTATNRNASAHLAALALPFGEDFFAEACEIIRNL